MLGFVQDGLPYVIPSNHGRVDDRLLLHGSTASRMMHVVESGAPLCVTFTLLDGLVLARSVFSHSVNYRSAVVFGTGELITDAAREAGRAGGDHRAHHARPLGGCTAAVGEGVDGDGGGKRGD